MFGYFLCILCMYLYIVIQALLSLKIDGVVSQMSDMFNIIYFQGTIEPSEQDTEALCVRVRAGDQQGTYRRRSQPRGDAHWYVYCLSGNSNSVRISGRIRISELIRIS